MQPPAPEQPVANIDPIVRKRILALTIIIGISWYIYQWIDSLPCPEDACQVNFN